MVAAKSKPVGGSILLPYWRRQESSMFWHLLRVAAPALWLVPNPHHRRSLWSPRRLSPTDTAARTTLKGSAPGPAFTCGTAGATVHPRTPQRMDYRAIAEIGEQEMRGKPLRRRFCSEASLARCLSEIRRFLEDNDQCIIKTVNGRGYLFAKSVSRRPVVLDPCPRPQSITAHPPRWCQPPWAIPIWRPPASMRMRGRAGI